MRGCAESCIYYPIPDPLQSFHKMPLIREISSNRETLGSHLSTLTMIHFQVPQLTSTSHRSSRRTNGLHLSLPLPTRNGQQLRCSHQQSRKLGRRHIRCLFHREKHHSCCMGKSIWYLWKKADDYLGLAKYDDLLHSMGHVDEFAYGYCCESYSGWWKRKWWAESSFMWGIKFTDRI